MSVERRFNEYVSQIGVAGRWNSISDYLDHEDLARYQTFRYYHRRCSVYLRGVQDGRANYHFGRWYRVGGYYAMLQMG